MKNFRAATRLISEIIQQGEKTKLTVPHKSLESENNFLDNLLHLQFPERNRFCFNKRNRSYLYSKFKTQKPFHKNSLNINILFVNLIYRRNNSLNSVMKNYPLSLRENTQQIRTETKG